MNLTFNEIRDGDHFEDLVADYFRHLVELPENNIASVDVRPSGTGTDGGRDILVEFDMSDDIKVFKRLWVVQCKFHDTPVSPTHVNNINLPTLIHSYKASGYLLVCKSRPTSGLTNLFERLNAECRNEYKYECWYGNQLLNKLVLRDDLHANYFPDYYEWVQTKLNVQQ